LATAAVVLQAESSSYRKGSTLRVTHNIPTKGSVKPVEGEDAGIHSLRRCGPERRRVQREPAQRESYESNLPTWRNSTCTEWFPHPLRLLRVWCAPREKGASTEFSVTFRNQSLDFACGSFKRGLCHLDFHLGTTFGTFDAQWRVLLLNRTLL
jgi:hypothetical protein